MSDGFNKAYAKKRIVEKNRQPFSAEIDENNLYFIKNNTENHLSFLTVSVFLTGRERIINLSEPSNQPASRRPRKMDEWGQA
jgi:hypothetical protein